ncbi:aspartate/glutamate/uridylate kinase family protein [Wolffia australiana]
MAANCDDDFGLLGDDGAAAQAQREPSHGRRHHHLPGQAQLQAASASGAFVTHRFAPTKGAGPIIVHPAHSLGVGGGVASPKKIGRGGAANDDEPVDFGEAFAEADAVAAKLPSGPSPAAPAFHGVNPHHCYGGADDDDAVAAAPNDFVSQQLRGDEDERRDCPDSGALRGAAGQVSHPSRADIKHKDREELSDGGSPYCFHPGSSGKKPRLSSAIDYRKDREEWSDSAIACLLDAYTEKYVQLNRGNLRGRDWEDVATVVSERCDKQKSGKSVEQCKNKVDNLKKRYKAERQRLSSGNLSVSHWPWFAKMEQIVGHLSAYCKPTSEDDKPVVGAGDGSSSSAILRQSKRYISANPGSTNLTNNMKPKSLSIPRWRRVVLKISGDAFTGNGGQNVDPKVMMLIAREIATASRVGVEVAIVVGGRNFFCGDSWVAATNIDRQTAYQIGMVGTVMNSVLLQASLEKMGVQTRVQTSFTMPEIAEPYIRRRAIRHLEKGRIVIFGGVGIGSGNPLFSTDTAAALRASELGADAVLKGTTVDSVMECHQRSNSRVPFEHLSFRELLSRGFTAMDATAITFCEENNIPVVVFNLLESGNLSRALCGDQVGTLVDQSGRLG